MAAEKGQNRRKPSAPRKRRADFTIGSQLLGKLGPGRYGRLLDKLRAEAKR